MAVIFSDVENVFDCIWYTTHLYKITQTEKRAELIKIIESLLTQKQHSQQKSMKKYCLL